MNKEKDYIEIEENQQLLEKYQDQQTQSPKETNIKKPYKKHLIDENGKIASDPILKNCQNNQDHFYQQSQNSSKFKRNFGKCYPFWFHNGDPLAVIGPDSVFFISHLVLFLLTFLTNQGIASTPLQIDQQDEELNLNNVICEKCNVQLKRGIKHCQICDVCVEDFDHHCPWVGKCIGKGNKNKNDVDTTYPHFFELRNEHNNELLLYAVQEEEHAGIKLYSQEQGSSSLLYNDNFVGIICRNYWGTQFELYDYGIAEDKYNKMPKYFSVKRQLISQISYQTNITASCPRKFEADILNLESKEMVKMKSLEPEYSEEKQQYQLNFYGRAKKASARNFELIPPGDENTIYLLHGKMSRNQFSLDFRHPLAIPQAFTFSLVSISKKYLVS